jgi:hypothetical protein
MARGGGLDASKVGGCAPPPWRRSYLGSLWLSVRGCGIGFGEAKLDADHRADQRAKNDRATDNNDNYRADKPAVHRKHGHGEHRDGEYRDREYDDHNSRPADWDSLNVYV